MSVASLSVGPVAIAVEPVTRRGLVREAGALERESSRATGTGLGVCASVLLLNAEPVKNKKNKARVDTKCRSDNFLESMKEFPLCRKAKPKGAMRWLLMENLTGAG